ncbi:hypothetical protein [Tateyamaria sp. ANG-S1]|uniref:hypothetical protein n=1 Tax=Tateyamaria sp. ANG-S1 TaxID=1577905 RepID=UPI00057D2798|nr:hypothetical protein [Tateyamaria sp. ANG-S1]KIC51045.1 hypothetical protein RA29_03970 [Tateyamaria sp. ANG-S1]
MSEPNVNQNNGVSAAIAPATVYRHETGPGMTLADFALLAIFLTSLILVPLALFAMGEETGPAASLKYLLVGFAAAGAAYGVNKFAVDRLAKLHAQNFRMAGLAAILGIMLTGFGTALGALTGLIIGSVEVKTYQAFGQEIGAYIGFTHEVAVGAQQIAPAVETLAADITQTAAGERASSSLSGNGNGGNGPVSRALDAKAGQVLVVAEALQQGTLVRDQRLEELNQLHAEFLEVLGDTDRPISDRRAAMQGIHAQIGQVAVALDQALPIGLVNELADDLRAGASVPSDPAGSRALSAYLRDLGTGLLDQLNDLPSEELVLPEMPDRPGMADVLRYIPAFLAIAAIVIVGELVLPLSLYLMTYWGHVREMEMAENEARANETSS